MAEYIPGQFVIIDVVTCEGRSEHFCLCFLIWEGPDRHSIIYDLRDGGCGFRKVKVRDG